MSWGHRDRTLSPPPPSPLSPVPAMLPRDTSLFRANVSLATGATCTDDTPNRTNAGYGDKGAADCAFFPLENGARLQFMQMMLLDVVVVLRRHSLSMGADGPLLAGGSLVGAIRDGEILPWSRDIDLDVSRALVYSIRSNTALRDELYKRGYHVYATLVGQWFLGKVCAHVGHPRVEALGTFMDCSPQKQIHLDSNHAYVDLFSSGLHLQLLPPRYEYTYLQSVYR